MNDEFSSRRQEFLARWSYFCPENRPDIPRCRNAFGKQNPPKPPPKPDHAVGAPPSRRLTPARPGRGVCFPSRKNFTGW